jgi:multiple sugar transport system substrate-binding protein
MALAVTAGRTPAAAQQITLTSQSWHLAEEPWATSIKQAFAEFEKENPDIKINSQPISLSQRDAALTTAIRAGHGPDLFLLDAAAVPRYIQEGWVKDLSGLMKADGGAKKFMSDFYPSARDVVTKNGKVYGIPHNISAMVLVYNKQMFADAGIAAPPKTWDEFRADAKKLTKATKPGGPIDQWGTALVVQPAGFDLRTSVILRGFGGAFLTPDNKHSALDSKEALQALKFIVGMVRDDKTMPPGVTQVDTNRARELMAQKKIGMLIGTTWTPTILHAINPDFDSAKLVGMAPIPHAKGEKPAVQSVLYLDALFMNPNTKHAEAAWKLLKFMTDDKRMQKWFLDNTMMSARKSVNETFGPIKNNEYAAAVRAEIPYAALLPAVPQCPQISTSFRQNLQAALDGSKTPEQALTDANTKVNSVLAK